MPTEPFPKLLRRLRRDAHMTQEELAEKAGYSPDYISMLERGLRVPPPLTLDILATALGVATAVLTAAPQAPEVARTRGREPLYGRDADRDRVLDAVSRARFVTLTGPGGVGKSSIARLVADAAMPQFRDGVVVIDLTPVMPDDVQRAISATVGCAGESFDELVASLRERVLLLVLDGCERFVAFAEQLGALVARCEHLVVLATSRVPLRVRAEHEVPIAPLESAPVGSALDELLASPAVALFIARARAVVPEFRCDLEQARLVATICTKLDGLPLAIELAAARVKHLSLAALAKRLERPLALLTGGARDLPARHQTMRDTIAWSHDLLDDRDRSHLRELSVFVGSFSLDAAEAVCGSDDILDAVARLVDASLLVVDAELADPRYRMLDTIREFASELAAQTPQHEVTRSRHAELFTRFAEAAEAGLRGREQAAWYARIDVDQGNLRAALDYLLHTGDLARAMRLGGSVWLFWQSRGDYEIGHALEDAIARGRDLPFAVRAKAAFGAAWLAFRRGEFARATSLHRELFDDALAAGDDVMARNALTVAAHVALATSAPEEAVGLFERCLELTRPLGPSWHLAMSLLNLGVGLLHARDLAGAQRRLVEARDMHTAIGDEVFAARATAYIGYAALLGDDLAAAEAQFTAATRAASQSSDSAGVAEGLAGLAALRAVQGRHADAAYLAGAYDVVRARTGWRPLPADRALWTKYFDAARAALGDTAWGDAVANGRRTSPY